MIYGIWGLGSRIWCLGPIKIIKRLSGYTGIRGPEWQGF